MNSTTFQNIRTASSTGSRGLQYFQSKKNSLQILFRKFSEKHCRQYFSAPGNSRLGFFYAHFEPSPLRPRAPSVKCGFIPSAARNFADEESVCTLVERVF
jgi:hypothetical protein